MKSRSFTFGPALAGVAYKDISFTGGTLRLPTLGPPFHVFVSPGDDYRYGFNGKEDDPEISWQDYGERMYDPRVARFPSADPLIVYGQRYVSLSPYQFAGLNPIQFIDLDGLEPAKPGTRKGQEDQAYDNSQNSNEPRNQYNWTWQGDHWRRGVEQVDVIDAKPKVIEKLSKDVLNWLQPKDDFDVHDWRAGLTSFRDKLPETEKILFDAADKGATKAINNFVRPITAGADFLYTGGVGAGILLQKDFYNIFGISTANIGSQYGVISPIPALKVESAINLQFKVADYSSPKEQVALIKSSTSLAMFPLKFHSNFFINYEIKMMINIAKNKALDKLTND
jgi:RHS repeat-associated protein